MVVGRSGGWSSWWLVVVVVVGHLVFGRFGVIVDLWLVIMFMVMLVGSRLE